MSLKVTYVKTYIKTKKTKSLLNSLNHVRDCTKSDEHKQISKSMEESFSSMAFVCLTSRMF